MQKSTRAQNLTPAFVSDELQHEVSRNAYIVQNMTRHEMFIKGFITVEDLDDQEIQAGKCKDRKGQLPPSRDKIDMLPRDLFTALVQEHQKRMNEKLRSVADRAIDTMVEVMDDKTAEPADRFKASQYLFERVAGKNPEKIITATAKEPWEEVFAGIGTSSREDSRNRREASRRRSIDPNDPNIIDVPANDITDQPVATPPSMFGRIPVNRQGEYAPPEAEAPKDMPSDHPSWQQEDGSHDTHQHGALGDDLLSDSQTCPPLEDQTVYSTPPYSAPSYQHPHGNSSTAPYTDGSGTPMPPLSERLRQQQEAANDLRAMRKEAQKARNNARKRRIVARTIGLDAQNPEDIKTEIQDAGDGTHNVTFRIE